MIGNMWHAGLKLINFHFKQHHHIFFSFVLGSEQVVFSNHLCSVPLLSWPREIRDMSCSLCGKMRMNRWGCVCFDLIREAFNLDSIATEVYEVRLGLVLCHREVIQHYLANLQLVSCHYREMMNWSTNFVIEMANHGLWSIEQTFFCKFWKLNFHNWAKCLSTMLSKCLALISIMTFIFPI